MLTRALNIEQHNALLSYLRETGRIEPREEPAVRTLPGGVSNRTVLVERATGEAWVLKQALEKLRVPVDWFSSPERIHREALGLRWLSELAPPGAVVPFVFEDFEHHVLAMGAVPRPHENWKTMLLAGRVEREHVEQFGRLLGTIHGKGYERRREVGEAFDDRSFFESLRLEPYYGYTAVRAPAAAPFLEALVEETRATRVTLVHGDYSPKNTLVHGSRLVLLDHEVIHFGEPAFDLGFSLAHLLSKGHHLPAARETFAGATQLYWKAYGEAVSGVPWLDGLEPRAVRHALACLLARVAGRSQLEYLDEEERARQRRAVIALLADLPETVDELTPRFLAAL